MPNARKGEPIKREIQLRSSGTENGILLGPLRQTSQNEWIRPRRMVESAAEEQTGENTAHGGTRNAGPRPESELEMRIAGGQCNSRAQFQPVPGCGAAAGGRLRAQSPGDAQ